MKSLPVHKNNIKRALACQDGRFFFEDWKGGVSKVKHRQVHPSALLCCKCVLEHMDVVTSRRMAFGPSREAIMHMRSQ